MLGLFHHLLTAYLDYFGKCPFSPPVAFDRFALMHGVDFQGFMMFHHSCLRAPVLSMFGYVFGMAHSSPTLGDDTVVSVNAGSRGGSVHARSECCAECLPAL